VVSCQFKGICLPLIASVSICNPNLDILKPLGAILDTAGSCLEAVETVGFLTINELTPSEMVVDSSGQRLAEEMSKKIVLLSEVIYGLVEKVISGHLPIIA